MAISVAYRGENTIDVWETRYSGDYDSPEVTAGFLEYYISTPGQLIPAASGLWPLLKRLRHWSERLYAGQALWQWAGIVLIVALITIFFFLMYTVGRWSSRRLNTTSHAWVAFLLPVANAAVISWSSRFLDHHLNITGEVDAAILVTSGLLLYLLAAMAIFRLSSAIADSLVYFTKRNEEDFDTNPLRVSSRAVGFIVGAVILVNGVCDLGLDVFPLVAGLGVGGLAVALAIRPTLENMIGGIILYADRPVQVGDFCSFGDNKRVVERIGLRSTRIRARDRTVITIPNSVFADMQITNWAKCDTILINTIIGLRYETTPDQLRRVMATMRQVCFAHPKIESDTLRIRFAAFGASSLDIAVRVYVLTTEWNDFFAVREDLFLRFAGIIKESGTSIAFPSATVYLGTDNGLDPEAIATAEREVESWREADELPYPLTPEPLATRIENTLDYPPGVHLGLCKKTLRGKRTKICQHRRNEVKMG